MKENKRTIRAIPQGGNNWQIHMDGEFVTEWECDTDSSFDAIEDYASSASINLDQFEISEDV